MKPCLNLVKYLRVLDVEDKSYFLKTTAHNKELLFFNSRKLIILSLQTALFVFTNQTKMINCSSSMKLTVACTIKNPPKLKLGKEIKNEIIGSDYDLTVIFIGRRRALTLNKKYRKKDYIPNILSFPLTNINGEIFICPEVAKTEAPDFNMTFENYLSFLLIHGLLHLKGLQHGVTMEKLEEKYIKLFCLL